MTFDPNRELLRHLLATIVFRANVAVRDAPANFADFKIGETVRTPSEILAHLGDLLEGSHYLMRGELVHLNSAPLSWEREVSRFITEASRFDAFLSSGAPLRQPIEKLLQGPIADALTHIGQLVMLRRAAGAPARAEAYFTAEIVAGRFDE
jgi:hypothetical protein